MAFGIPSLLNHALQVNNTITLLLADAPQILSMISAPQWGIYSGDSPILLADSVVEVSFRGEWRLADYPVEQGAFESYNKVKTPYIAHVRMAKGGSASDRQMFLDNLETIAQSLDLYDVVTPEKVYENANVTTYEYKRTSQNGAGMITADIVLNEVMLTATQSFSKTIAPSGASIINGGTVQPGDSLSPGEEIIQ